MQHSFVMPERYSCSYMKELNRIFNTENFCLVKQKKSLASHPGEPLYA